MQKHRLRLDRPGGFWYADLRMIRKLRRKRICRVIPPVSGKPCWISRHPDQPLTVREIAAGVEPDGVSLSAVYRNLAELEAAGLIRRESRPGSREAVVQYVGAENCRGHLHLTCTRCGRTVHLSSAAASLLTGMAAGEGFSLDLTRTALYGLCPRCRQEVQP